MRRSTNQRRRIAGLPLAILFVGMFILSTRFCFELECTEETDTPSSFIYKVKLFVGHGVSSVYIKDDAWHIKGPWKLLTNVSTYDVSVIRSWPEFSLVDDYYSASLPLWIPPCLIALPSLALWWRNRRNNGHCDCGYNLTGNVSGVCPECGKDITNMVTDHQK